MSRHRRRGPLARTGAGQVLARAGAWRRLRESGRSLQLTLWIWRHEEEKAFLVVHWLPSRSHQPTVQASLAWRTTLLALRAGEIALARFGHRETATHLISLAASDQSAGKILRQLLTERESCPAR